MRTAACRMPGMRGALVLLLTLAAALPCAAASTAELESKGEHLDALRERIAEVKARIEGDREARGEAAAALAQAEQRIAAQAARLQASRAAIAATQAEVEALSAHAQALQAKLGGKLGALAARMDAAYRTGRHSPLRLVLSQQDPVAVGRLLTYYGYYAAAQEAAIDALRADLAVLADTRRALRDQRAQLQAQRQRAADSLAALKQARGERQQAVATLDAQLAEQGQSLAALKADAAQLEGLIASLRAALAALPPAAPAPGLPFGQLEGKLTAPVSGPVIAAFGTPKANGRLRWQGVWLGAPAGAPVRAAAPGRVVYVGWMHRYGLIVVLDHGGDYYTVYGHNRSVATTVGERVAAGAVIAAAGTTGGHATSGVYFEIRHGTEPVDPERWLASS